MLTKVLHGKKQPSPFFIFLTCYERDVILNFRQKVNFNVTNIAMWLNSETSRPNSLLLPLDPYLGNPGLCTPDIKMLLNESMNALQRFFEVVILLMCNYFPKLKHIFFLFCKYFAAISVASSGPLVHHNPCFNLFMLHNNQESKMKNNISTYCLLWKRSSYYYLPATKKVFVKDSKLKYKKSCLYIYIYAWIYIYI